VKRFARMPVFALEAFAADLMTLARSKEERASYYGAERVNLVTMMRLRGIILLTLIGGCVCFIGNANFAAQKRQTPLHLVPIENFRSECKFLDESDDYRCCFDKNGTLDEVANGDGPSYQLCLVQEEDLPDVARFVVNAFGADVISLSKDFSRFEQALVKPTIGLLNAYSGIVAYAEVLSGLQSRTRDRIEDPNLNKPNLSGKTREEKLKEAAKSSLVLAVARPSQGSDWHIDVIASVELRLEVRFVRRGSPLCS